RRLLLLDDRPGAEQGRCRGHGPAGPDALPFLWQRDGRWAARAAALRPGPGPSARPGRPKGAGGALFGPAPPPHGRARPRRPAREVERGATYFYYAWSVAHTFRALGIAEIDSDGRKLAWAEALASELIRRQRDDGTWVNPFTASKEDDPLVATPFAAGALGIC